jgi:cytoskeletal protein CcmA (bactofilin family)
MPESSLARVPESVWSDPEKWVWEKVCKGEVADFNLKFQNELKPQDSEGWTADRMIRAEFLETVLLLDPYKSSLPRRGLRIAGALIKEKIDLSNARITSEWWIDKSRFEESVTLYSAIVSNYISFARSFFSGDFSLHYLTTNSIINIRGIRVEGALTMSNISVENGLLFGDGAKCKNVYLDNARIGRNLSMSVLKVEGELNMGGITVGSDLIMLNLDVEGNIRLVAGNVKGQVQLNGIITGTINMNGLFMDGSLFMDGGTTSSELNLTGARIAGQADLTGVKISGGIEMSGLVVGEDLQMTDGVELGELNLIGAKIGGKLDMSAIKIIGDVSMDGIIVVQDLLMNEKATFQNVKMTGAQVGGELRLDSSIINQSFSMSSIDVKSHIFLNDSVIKGEANLRSARIQGTLHLIGTKIEGKLFLDRISVNSSLYMRQQAEFMHIDMRSAKIGVDLELSGISVKKSLLMNNVSVSGRLLMIKGSSFSDIDMIGATIGAQFDLTNLTVAKEFEMQSIVVSGNIFIRSCVFNKRISLIDSTINGSIVTSSNTITNLDLGGTTVQRELQIGIHGQMNIWEGQASINLSNANVRSLSDGGADSWPEEVRLDGFIYSGLGQGARNERTNDDISKRRIEWFIGWLAKTQPYSWPTYNHLAQLFDRGGESVKANRVLYASKERERRDARENDSWGKVIGLSLLKWIIGYGYGTRYFRSLIWVLALLIIGVLIIGTVETGAMKSAPMIDKVGFSLDKLLPIIKINDAYKFDFHGWQLAYFYVQEIFGFVLGSFVVAGISGITKR